MIYIRPVRGLFDVCVIIDMCVFVYFCVFFHVCRGRHQESSILGK